MSKLKIGVFGAYRGQRMVRFLMKHPDAELVAICDKYKPALEKCREYAEELNVKVHLFENFDDFIECDMDAVVLANYANEHAPFAIRCLESGRHVLSEVLAAQTMSEAVRLVETVEKTGLVYSFAENFCYFRTTFEMKLRYQRGDIGELVYGEGEYVHDCTARWPSLTYGDPNHWRNLMYSTFYVSHSLGPIITITGTRPKRIVGFEGPMNKRLHEYGALHAVPGLVVMQMDNGAVVKSLHGDLKREPTSYWTSIYGTKGCMEADRWGHPTPIYKDKVGQASRMYRLNTYIEGPESCEGEYVNYEPAPYIDTELSRETIGHYHADFYMGHFFIEKILGREDGKHSIDVYQAMDICVPGMMAYRSILGGNVPVEYPDLRDPAVRDKYRNDNACADPKVAGDQLLPSNSWGVGPVSQEKYKIVEEMWKRGIPG